MISKKLPQKYQDKIHNVIHSVSVNYYSTDESIEDCAEVLLDCAGDCNKELVEALKMATNLNRLNPKESIQIYDKFLAVALPLIKKYDI